MNATSSYLLYSAPKYESNKIINIIHRYNMDIDVYNIVMCSNKIYVKMSIDVNLPETTRNLCGKILAKVEAL